MGIVRDLLYMNWLESVMEDDEWVSTDRNPNEHPEFLESTKEGKQETDKPH